MAARKGSAEWRGTLKEGTGQVTVGDGAFEGSYSFTSRFEEGDGTNPEELIGTALAACFSMALSNELDGHGHTPESVKTAARVHLRRVDDVTSIAKIELETEGKVQGIDEAHFREHAEQTKNGCIISRALAGVEEIEVTARLVD